MEIPAEILNLLESLCPQTQDERWMLHALRQACKAYERGEVPIGAVLVHENRVICQDHNRVEQLQDATAHAEMLCLSAASPSFDSWRLLGATLYSTLEPCAMCAGAAQLSRVDRLVYGAPDFRHGACGSLCNLFESPHPIHCVKITTGILAPACGLLLQSFFRQRRIKKKENTL